MKKNTLDQQQLLFSNPGNVTLSWIHDFLLKNNYWGILQYDIDNIVKSYKIELEIFSCGIALIIKSLSLKNHPKLTLQTRVFSQRYK